MAIPFISYSISNYTIYWCNYICAVEAEFGGGGGSRRWRRGRGSEAEVEAEFGDGGGGGGEFNVRVRISCGVLVVVVVVQASGFARGMSFPVFISQSISIYLFPVSD